MHSKAAEDNIQIKIEVPSTLPDLEADPNKLKQVILNLLSNAIKYNRPNGKIVLQAKKEREEIRLTVKDTGYGIPEESMPNLFNKFFRVRETESSVAGTGLGLAISKQIVLGHKGTIEVKSKLGKGTSFIIRLPLRAAR